MTLESSASAEASGALPVRLAGLLNPRAYPHPLVRVSLLQTPLSWVLLAGAFAYKIKRPVHYAFLDQRTLQRRRELCEEELRLNRRFAPQLYQDVCSIVAASGGLVVRSAAGAGETVIEYAVRMLRFGAAERLDRLLAEGRIEPAALAAFGRALAALHATLPVVTEDVPWGRPEHVSTMLLRNLDECAAASSVFAAGTAVMALRARLEQRLFVARPWMALRRTSGRVRECHGDLHSRNIARWADQLIAFDCLEYEPTFRWIDVADEIAFLVSDLAARHYGVHAHAFRSAYLEHSGDYHACRVLKLYEAHRALVRAKVAALAAASTSAATARAAWRKEHALLLAHAQRALSEPHPRLVLMSGLSGTGKTWLARQLAVRLDALHVRSDVERKRRAGMMLLERSGAGLAQGMYASDASADVHEDMARAARDALIGGVTVIIDATLLRRAERRRFADLGAQLGIRPSVVCCQAPVPVLRARLLARAAAGADPSEADASVLEWQRLRAEPVGEDEPLDVVVVDVEDSRVVDDVLERLQVDRT